MEDQSAEIVAIIEGSDDDYEAAEKLRALGVPDPLAWELVLSARHDGEVDNVEVVIDRP